MTATTGKTVNLVNSEGKQPVVQEGESVDITGQLRIGTRDIIKSELSTLSLTLYDEATDAVINTRNGVDILDNNGGEVATGGSFTMKLDPADNPIVDATKSTGDLEFHIARFTWTWLDGATTRTGKQQVRFPVEKIASPS